MQATDHTRELEEDSTSCVIVAVRDASVEATNQPVDLSSHVPPRVKRNREVPTDDDDDDHGRSGPSASREEKEGDAEEAAADGSKECLSYQTDPRFGTWRKHVCHLYQTVVHVDLVWESPSVQLMPFMTMKDGVATQTVLSGTRTGGQEQSYLQFFSISTPSDSSRLDDPDTIGFCEVTGEVGGYGRASSACGMKIERRMFHDGDVLAARYMYSNPLLIATASSNGNLYIFDWSRVSLQLPPNKPERPRGPLPPNALTEDATDEERSLYMKRMRQINDVDEQQQMWDAQKGPGQHMLTLTGMPSPTTHVEWSTAEQGALASGGSGCVHVWQVGNLSKSAERTVQPIWSAEVEVEVEGDDDTRATVNDTRFCWDDPHTLLAGLSDGTVMHGDTRMPSRTGLTPLFQLNRELGSCNQVAVSPLEPTTVAVATDRRCVCIWDMRNAAEPVATEPLHASEVYNVQWSPHRRSLLATSGEDGVVTLYDTVRQQILFKHAGHTEAVTDLCWNWHDAFSYHIVSTDRNALMMWRPRDMFLRPS